MFLSFIVDNGMTVSCYRHARIDEVNIGIWYVSVMSLCKTYLSGSEMCESRLNDECIMTNEINALYWPSMKCDGVGCTKHDFCGVFTDR